MTDHLTLPEDLPVPEDDGAATQVGIDWATEQCAALLRGGVPGIHFYTLNRAQSVRAVLENLAVAA